MSNALTKARQRHQKAMVAACPGVVTLGGVSYAAAAAVRPGMLQNEDGGQRSGNVLTVSIAKAALATAPARLSKLTYAQQVWIIEEVAGTEAWAQEWILTARL
jgi:hypothetical protein